MDIKELPLYIAFIQHEPSKEDLMRRQADLILTALGQGIITTEDIKSALKEII